MNKNELQVKAQLQPRRMGLPMSSSEYVVDTRAEGDGQVPGNRRTARRVEGLLDVHHATVAETTINRTIASIFQRDEKAGGKKSTQQSLDIYDMFGNTSNPAEGNNFDALRGDISNRIERASQRLSVKEQEYMGMMLPELVGAIVLDERYVDRVYGPDMGNVVGVAIDWFQHPEAVGQSHIRIGFGGEEKVSSRAPAYLVPALQSVERIKNVFERQGNFARLNELHSKVQADATANVAQWFHTKFAEHDQQKGKAARVKDKKMGLSVPQNMGPDDFTALVTQAWSELAGEEPNIDELAAQYFPQIQVEDIDSRMQHVALVSGLRDTIKQKNAAMIDAWINDQMRERMKSKSVPSAEVEDNSPTEEPKLEVAWDAYLGLDLPKGSTSQDLTDVLDNAWVTFTGENPDLDDLQQKYHFSDQLPKVVVFNAANAAIEINAMDRDKVLEARDNTQALLKGYAERFHPSVAGQLEFQNDQPWENHDYYTRMLFRYTHDLMLAQNGKKRSADQQLERFGEHHQKAETHFATSDMSGFQVYAGLHGQFFMDPLETSLWADKIPDTAIMEPIERPRNLLYHQGPPEIVFGVYRKLYAQNATLSGFTEWLDQRYSAASNNYGDHAEAVLQKARELQAADTKDRPFRAHLGQAINMLLKKEAQAKTKLFGHMSSASFNEADDPEASWEAFTQHLRATTPTEPAEQIAELRDQMMAKQQDLSRLKEEVSIASQHGDYERLDELAEHPDAPLAHYPIAKVEAVVKVGEQPVYYPVPGADSVVYPEFAYASMDNYDDKLEQARGRSKRMRGTTAYINRQAVETVSGATEGVQAMTPWDLFGDTPQQFIEQTIGDEAFAQWIATDTQRFAAIYEFIDLQELKGMGQDDVAHAVNESVDLYTATRIQEVIAATGMPEAHALAFLQKFILPQATRLAMETTLTQNAVALAQAEAVKSDYELLLSDIDTDQTVAEEAYNGLLSDTFQGEKVKNSDIQSDDTTNFQSPNL